MRLNESSMDKPFDLIAMGFKSQRISCTHPSELIQVTLNHLHALRDIVIASAPLVKLLEDCIRTVHAAYDDMSVTDLNAMRQEPWLALARSSVV